MVFPELSRAYALRASSQYQASYGLPELNIAGLNSANLKLDQRATTALGDKPNLPRQPGDVLSAEMGVATFAHRTAVRAPHTPWAGPIRAPVHPPLGGLVLVAHCLVGALTCLPACARALALSWWAGCSFTCAGAEGNPVGRRGNDPPVPVLEMVGSWAGRACAACFFCFEGLQIG